MKPITEKLFEELKNDLEKAGDISNTVMIALDFFQHPDEDDHILSLQHVMTMQKIILDKCSKILEDLE